LRWFREKREGGEGGRGLKKYSAAPAKDDSEMWNVDFDELDFEHVIGTGKFGEVYFGYYLGTPVAIKSKCPSLSFPSPSPLSSIILLVASLTWHTRNSG
jgi:hypothetical protein